MEVTHVVCGIVIFKMKNINNFIKKNDRTILLVAAAIALFIIFSQSPIFKKQIEPEVGLRVHYYSNGVEIFPDNQFSSIIIPSNVESADEISFDIIINNTGNTLINNTLEWAYPIEFKNALPTGRYTVNPKELKTITTGRISTVPLESYEQPINFTVNVSGVVAFPENPSSYKIYSSASTSLAILSSAWCYQEDVKSVTTGDGSCGQLYTGQIGTGGGTNIFRIYDKNWGTYGLSGSTEGNYIYFNYTKPVGAVGALWKVKDGSGNAILKIPSTCWNSNSNKLILRIYSISDYPSPNWACGDNKPCYTVVWSCYIGGKYSSLNVEDNPSWIRLRNPSDNRATADSDSLPYVYEEGVYWDVPK